MIVDDHLCSTAIKINDSHSYQNNHSDHHNRPMYLSPNEVNFNSQDQSLNKRKRLTTISSEVSDLSQYSCASNSTYKGKKKIPDGGYGWVIVFASFMVSFIADGISFSFGLLYSELLDYFNAGTTKTAWIGSLFMSVPLISGPIMSNLVDKYGCQKMTMIGGVFGCMGFVLSAISNNVEILFVSFGIISGLGLGVIYVTAVVSIAFWFEKKRTFATGIGASGTGFGTFMYAPLTQWLIQEYGWRGATLILGGTLLNFCVFGALMIDPEWLVEENKLGTRSQSIQTFTNSSMNLDEIKKMIETGEPKEEVLETLLTNFNTDANQQIADNSFVGLKKFQSEILFPTFVLSGLQVSRSNTIDDFEQDKQTVSSTDEVNVKTEETLVNNCDSTAKKCKIASAESLNTFEKMSSTNRAYDLSSLNLDELYELESNDVLIDVDERLYYQSRGGIHGSRLSLNEKIIATMSLPACQPIKKKLKRNIRIHSISNDTKPCLYKNSSEHKVLSQRFKTRCQSIPFSHRKTSSLRYSNYLKNMRVHRNSINYRGAMLSTHRYRLKASSCPNIFRNSMTTIAKEDEVWYDDLVDLMKSIFDFSLFFEYKFGMMSLSTLLLFVWYIIPYFYINELLIELDYTEEASAYLISIIGIFNTVGMIFFGWTGDQRWCDVIKTYAFCLCLCGISMFLIPLATWSYVFLMILSAIFGITFGSSFSFTPLITTRLVEMDDFTVAYGLILLVQGIGSLIGPPLAGWIHDVSGRWDDSFYIGGFLVVVSGFLAYIIGSIDLENDDEDCS